MTNHLKDICDFTGEDPSDVLSMLVAARQVIASRKPWTQGAAARDAEGREADPLQPEATCFCSIGALVRVAPGRSCSASSYLSALAREVCGRGGVANYNDHHTHTEVLAWWDLAIERATAELREIEAERGATP